jgi:hypothetical protein
VEASDPFGRPLDIVEISADWIPELDGTPISHIHLYRWGGDFFVPIPFQIDEIRRWDLEENVTECVGRFPDKFEANCELNYDFQYLNGGVPGGNGSFDQWRGEDNQVYSGDELVFRGRDAGPRVAPSAWIDGTMETRYELAITDPRDLDGDGTVGERKAWVYLFVYPQAHPVDYDTQYVDWTHALSDPDRPESCRTGDESARGEKACGWATGQDANDFHPTLDARWIGNHTMNRLKVARVDESSGADILDRCKMRVEKSAAAEVQESEESWDTAGCPRFLGLKAPNNATAPVRVIRLSQATESGGATTRTDRYYGTHLRTRYRLRVHPGVPALRQVFEPYHNEADAELFNTKYPPSGSTPADTIDGDGPAWDDEDGTTVGEYSSSSSWNWNQLETSDEGRIAWFIHEEDPIEYTIGPRYFYGDEGTDHSEPPEFEPGRFGAHGVIWEGESRNMQDLECNPINPDDPPGTDMLAELEIVVVPLRNGAEATDYLAWLEHPLNSTVLAQQYSPDPPPPPIDPPCPPSLGLEDPQNASFLELNPTISGGSGCTADAAGFMVSRAVGLAEFRPVGQIRPGQVYKDRTVRHGVTYRYRVHALNAEGVYTVGTEDVSVTVEDLQAPDPPADVSVEPRSGGAEVTWEGSGSQDVDGYDLLASTDAGGPYTKLNASLLPLTARSWVVSGLDPDVTYFLVVKAVDAVGNESVASNEVMFTPLP